MKTERRHELETNTLAKRLARWVEVVKPYSKVVGGLIVAALVIAALTVFVRRQTASAEAVAWDAYYQATEGGGPSLDELLDVADAHPGTSVEPWARIAWADAQLLVGSRLLFHDRNTAQQYLGRAIDTYVKLKDDATNDMIRQRAIYGLARANEASSHLDRAHEEYDQVGGVFAAVGKARAKLIEAKRSKEFYDWFAQAKMPQAVQPTDPGIPGQKPDFSVEGLDEGAATGTPPAVSLPAVSLPAATGESSDGAAGESTASPPGPAAVVPDTTAVTGTPVTEESPPPSERPASGGPGGDAPK